MQDTSLSRSNNYLLSFIIIVYTLSNNHFFSSDTYCIDQIHCKSMKCLTRCFLRHKCVLRVQTTHYIYKLYSNKELFSFFFCIFQSFRRFRGIFLIPVSIMIIRNTKSLKIYVILCTNIYDIGHLLYKTDVFWLPTLNEHHQEDFRLLVVFHTSCT